MNAMMQTRATRARSARSLRSEVALLDLPPEVLQRVAESLSPRDYAGFARASTAFEQEYVHTGEGQASQKRQKDSSKHVGEPSKGGCSRPRDMICRQHEFVMGHHRDPTVRYLAIALLTYGG